MTEEHISKKFPEKGLLIGDDAPFMQTKDIYGNEVNFEGILKKYDYILADFFRGAW